MSTQLGSDGVNRNSSSDNTSSGSKPANNPFVCHICHRTYGRVDHLARHFRSHTNEKPFKCDECGKTFARTDLLKRHIGLHSSTEKDGTKRRLRASQACAACAAVKVKCDTKKPCGRCTSRGLVCTVESQASARLAKPTGGIDPSPDRDLEMSHDDGQQPAAALTPSDSGSYTATPSQREQWVGQGVPSVYSEQDASVMEPEDTALTRLLRDVIYMAPGCTGISTPRDVMDFSTDRGVDFSGLDNMLTSDWEAWLDPMLAPMASQSANFEDLPDAPTPPVDGSINMSSAAYERSAWRWDPKTQAQSEASKVNLASTLTEGQAQKGIPHHQPLTTSSKFHLSSSDREKMTTLLLSACHASNYQTITALFPATKFLSSFLSDFCLSIDQSIDSWIHLPTFQVSECRPGFLCLMVACGAVLSRSSYAQKFGYAVHETASPTIRHMFESDNKTTRVLQPLQTLAMYLKIGTFSGNKRTMEIAESGSLSIVTMLRRGGRFRRSQVHPPDPCGDDPPNVLDEKWRAWVIAESFKRIAYHVFIYSVQLSIAFQTPTLVSYSEITLPLPAPRALWRAENAAQWREQFFAYRQDEPLPSFLSCVSDPSVLEAVRDRVDLDLSMYLMLLSHWSFSWEYTQLSSLNKAQINGSPEWTGTLLASSKREEIHRLIDTWKIATDSWSVKKPKEIQIMVPLLYMNLFVGFQDLQLLAGKEGTEEARYIYPALKEWFKSPECRQSLWYAAQVLRAARLPPLRCLDPSLAPTANTLWLRDFTAIELYHAALVFWVYGVMSRAISIEQGHALHFDSDEPEKYCGTQPQPHTDPPVDYQGDHIFLDGEDESLSAMQRHDFVGLNKGLAVISTSSPSTDEFFESVNAPQSIISPSSLSSDLGFVPLHDTRRVMEVVISVLALDTHDELLESQRFAHIPEPRRPALVDNLIQLLRDLGEAASTF